MFEPAAVGHPRRHRQPHEGIELGLCRVARIFRLDEQVLGIADVHLGLEHVQTRAQTHIIKSLRDAQLIPQAGQGVLLAADVLLGLEVGKEGFLHVAGHGQFGLTQGGPVALGLEGGLLVLGQQAEALENGLGDVHAHAPGAEARRAGGTRGGGALPLLLVGLIAQTQLGAELAAGRLPAVFGGAARGFLSAEAGVVRQRALHGVGHGHGPAGRMAVRARFRPPFASKERRLEGLVDPFTRRSGQGRGKVAGQKRKTDCEGKETAGGPAFVRGRFDGW